MPRRDVSSLVFDSISSKTPMQGVAACRRRPLPGVVAEERERADAQDCTRMQNRTHVQDCKEEVIIRAGGWPPMSWEYHRNHFVSSRGAPDVVLTLNASGGLRRELYGLSLAHMRL